MDLGSTVGSEWAKTCDFGSDLSQGRPRISLSANVPNFKYTALHDDPFNSACQILSPIGESHLGT